jgi:MFS-type transporter involved in bile tolerance (Atg22 family)
MHAHADVHKQCILNENIKSMRSNMSSNMSSKRFVLAVSSTLLLASNGTNSISWSSNKSQFSICHAEKRSRDCFPPLQRSLKNEVVRERHGRDLVAENGRKARTVGSSREYYITQMPDIPRGGQSSALHSTEKMLVDKQHARSPTTTEGDELQNGKMTSNVYFLIRVLFLTFYGSLGALMPYLPVYYHSLGHNGIYIGMLGAVKPFTTFVVAPLWGVLGDKTGAHHKILHYTFVSSVLLETCLFLRREVWFLVMAGFLAALLNAPVKSLLDNMVMDILPVEGKANYGKLRLWGQLGFGLGSSVIGVVLSHTCGAKGDMLPRFLRGYGVAFFSHAILAVPAFLCMKAFEDMSGRLDVVSRSREAAPKKESNAGGAKIWEGLDLLVHNADAVLFFFLVLVVGVSSGIIENFAYVRMREVGGTGKEMGLSRLVSSCAGAPMFWFSGPLTSKLGADKVLVMAILSYVVRFVIYASMPSPLYGLPAEALRGITFAAFWSTGTVYAHKISPPGMNATLVSETTYSGIIFFPERHFSRVCPLSLAHVFERDVWRTGTISWVNNWRENAVTFWYCFNVFIFGNVRFLLRRSGRCLHVAEQGNVFFSKSASIGDKQCVD